MNHLSPSTPYGYTIFCDDIRQEDNGKLIYIGVYSGVMYAPQFPITVSALALRIFYFERPNESNEAVELRIYLPGQEEDSPAIKLQLAEDFRKSVPMLEVPAETSWDKPETFMTGIFHLKLSPMELKEAGLIRVRAIRGENSIKLGSLRVELPPKQTQPS